MQNNQLNSLLTMSRKIYGAIFCLLLALPIVSNAKLIWELPIKEQSALSTDTSIAYKFVSKNTSRDTPIRISNVKADCGCTTTEFGKKIIKPGEKTEVTVYFDPRGKEGFYEKKVTVYSDDINNPVTFLTLRALVKSPFMIRPGFVYFTDDEIASQKSIVVSLDKNTGFSFDGIKQTLGDLNVQLFEKNDGTYKIDISLNGPEEFERGRFYLLFVGPMGESHQRILHVLRK